MGALSEVPMQGLGEYPERATPGTHCGFAVLGSSPGVRQFDLTGFELGTPAPWVVLCQPRQSLNSKLNCGDLFSVQVISTSRTTIRIVVGNAHDGAGWGQQLRVDVMVVE